MDGRIAMLQCNSMFYFLFWEHIRCYICEQPILVQGIWSVID